MSHEAASAFAWFAGLEGRRNRDGTRAFTEQELDDFFAALLLSIGFDVDELPVELRGALAAFARRAGVVSGASPEETCDSIAAYFEKSPLRRELVIEFKEKMRAVVLSEDPHELGRAFARFVPERRSSTVRSAAGSPPEGAVRGGALGFFAAREKLSGK